MSWLVTHHFGLQGRQEHHQMKVNGFTLQHDGNGSQYLTGIVERCPIMLFKRYLEKLQMEIHKNRHSMTSCSLLRLLILKQPSIQDIFFFFSGQLAINSVGLVAKGFFRHQIYIHSFYFHKPTNVNKNTALKIALNTFCFTIGEEFKRIVFFIVV